MLLVKINSAPGGMVINCDEYIVVPVVPDAPPYSIWCGFNPTYADKSIVSGISSSLYPLAITLIL